MDGACISQKAEELVALEAWHAALPAKATRRLTPAIHYVLASPYSSQPLISNRRPGEADEWVSTPWLWMTFVELYMEQADRAGKWKSSQGIPATHLKEHSRRELAWDQLLT